MKKIVAIHGLMGHGKDTVGAMIAKVLRERMVVKNLRFADTVKEQVQRFTRVCRKAVDTTSYNNIVWDFDREQKAMYLEKWGMTLGRMLQIYATEAVRDNLHEDTWVFALEEAISGENEDDKFNTLIVVTDLRFPNEINWLKSLGHAAITIKVIRDHQEKDGRDAKHASEKGLPDSAFDVIIHNDGTLEDLEEKVRSLCTSDNWFTMIPVKRV